MKGVRFTKAEVAVIKSAIQLLCSPWGSSGADEKAASRVIAKLDAAETAPAGVDVGPLEEALMKESRGKVIKLLGGYAVASRRATQMKVTVEEAVAVGAWMSRQSWLTGPMTLLDVFNTWYQWLPKARATEPPPSLAPGLDGRGRRRDTEDGTDGRGPAPAGQTPSGRRSAPGLR